MSKEDKRREGVGARSRLLLIEDNDLVVRSLRRGLRTLGFEVVVAMSFAAAVQRITSGEVYQVVVVDLVMPDGNGADLLPRLATLTPRPIVVVVSGHLSADRAVDVTGLCDASIPKPVSPRHIAKAVANAATSPSDPVGLFAKENHLTPKEREVVRLAALGASTVAQAQALGWSTTTLKTYWQRIFEKTGHRSKTGVIASIFTRTHRRAEPTDTE